MRRTHPHPEGEEEEPLHVLPPECVHLLRERQAPRPIPVGHGPSEGFRRRLERTRLDEAVNRARGSRLIRFRPFSRASGGGGAAAKCTLSLIASENPIGAFHSV